MTRTARIELDIRRRIWQERLRWRLLRFIPRSIVYWVVIRAWVEVCRDDEHPDSLKASDVAQRWQG